MSVKAEILFDLAIKMTSTREGVCIDDIIHEYSVSRRTAERMRDSICRIFPQMEEAPYQGDLKRWRLPSGVIGRLLTFNIDEILALENAIKQAKQSPDINQVKNLEGLLQKILSIQPDKQKLLIGPDLEALLQAEGFAFRVGPRQNISPDVISDIRHAVLAFKKVRIRYESRMTGKITTQKICPYGLIYGNHNYLIAFSLNPNVLNYRLYRLSNINKITLLDENFDRDKTFSLEKYMHNSFGVYQEPPYEIVWKFNPNAALDAKDWCFHPTQTLEELEDGSLIVKFTAGGRKEMEWHLFTWGNGVEDLTNYSTSPSTNNSEPSKEIE